jgi:hypothetical protein
MGTDSFICPPRIMHQCFFTYLNVNLTQFWHSAATLLTLPRQVIIKRKLVNLNRRFQTESKEEKTYLTLFSHKQVFS